MSQEGWGKIDQNFNVTDSSWSEAPANKSNNLQAENNWRTPAPTWGSVRPSAPSENNLGVKKINDPVQESWGPNKSENSWVSRNNVIQVDQSWANKSSPEKESAKSSYNEPSNTVKLASDYKALEALDYQHEDKEEKLDVLISNYNIYIFFFCIFNLI